MKIKLDENLGSRSLHLFHEAGHDTSTVADENLCGTSDRELIDRCQRENRALVTLDLDFANPLRFRPAAYSGIAVLRPSAPISATQLDELCRTLADALGREDLQGERWIVERGRIRIYQQPEH